MEVNLRFKLIQFLFLKQTDLGGFRRGGQEKAQFHVTLWQKKIRTRPSLNFRSALILSLRLRDVLIMKPNNCGLIRCVDLRLVRGGLAVRKRGELDMLRRLSDCHVGRRLEWCADRGRRAVRRNGGLNRAIPL